MSTNKEIEIRAKLLNSIEVEKFFDSNHISKTYENHQTDTYFDNPSFTFFSDPECVDKWLRVREESGRLTLNYKHWLPEDEPIKTYCDETEFQLSSMNEMRDYLVKLGFDPYGFEPVMVVDKTRRSYIYKDCEISIDSVEGLGDYIEIEYKGKSSDIKKIQDLLNNILNEINAAVGEMDYKGYAYNLLKLKFKNRGNIDNDKF